MLRLTWTLIRVALYIFLIVYLIRYLGGPHA